MDQVDVVEILLDYHSETDVFGRSIEGGEDISLAPIVMPESDILAAMRRHYAGLSERFENTQRERLLGGVHHSVISEWGKKGPAAIAYLSGGATAEQVQILQDEADITGESLEQLAQTVSARYGAYLSIGPKITGRRREIQARIDAAETPQDVVDVYNQSRQAAQLEADQIAQALGVA